MRCRIIGLTPHRVLDHDVIPLAINYCLVLPPATPDRYSEFQGFEPSLLGMHSVVHHILRSLPPNILELGGTDVVAFRMRMCGIINYHILPLTSTYLDELPIGPGNPLWVIFSSVDTRSDVVAATESWSIPILHCELPSYPTPLAPFLPSREIVTAHCRAVLKQLESARDAAEFLKGLSRELDCQRGDHNLCLRFDVWNHNTTLPNETTLMSVGGSTIGVLPELVGPEDMYVEAICQSVDRVTHLRNLFSGSAIFSSYPRQTSLILTSPGMYPHMRKIRFPSGTEWRAARDVHSMLRSQSEYAMTSDAEQLDRIRNDPLAGYLLQVRTLELHTYTAALAIRAASTVSPVVRLPTRANGFFHERTRFVDAARSYHGGHRKLQRMAGELFSKIAGTVPEPLMRLIDSRHDHIKLVTDAPLEWLPVRGLPLMLRNSTSRVPTTPGALSFLQILQPDTIDVTLKDFDHILVLRSFKSGDPLRRDLENAVRLVSGFQTFSYPVQFVDIKCRRDLVAALNAFNGALVVFDGHGSHPRDSEIGVLHLEKENVSLWEIRRECRIPPIAFLCSCDSHAADRSHVTPANGLLYCGARTVVSSVLPIESKAAARFFARLVLRLFEFLPILAGYGISMRWDEVVSRLQRMTHISDLFYSVFGVAGPVNEVLAQANVIIQQSGPDWFEESLQIAEARLKLPMNAIRKVGNEKLPFGETLKYVQIGNPETIVVHPSDGRVPSTFRRNRLNDFYDATRKHERT